MSAVTPEDATTREADAIRVVLAKRDDSSDPVPQL